MKSISLKKFNIKRPEKILYNYPISSLQDLFNQIKSISLKKHLRGLDIVLEKENIAWKYKELTKQGYLDWLVYYKEKIKERNYIIRANEKWYDEEISKGWKIKGLFVFKNDKMIGSSIVALRENVASFAFKVSDKINLHKHSVGSLVELLKLREVSKEGNISKIITRSPNAFGVSNTVGYLELRLRFGYNPILNPDADLSDTTPINAEGYALFYGIYNTELYLYLLQPEGQCSEKQLKNIISLSEIPFKKIYY